MVVVYDGQLYYQSTGTKSKAPGTWLPFIMVLGTKEKKWDALPPEYNRDQIKKLTWWLQTKNAILPYQIWVEAIKYYKTPW